MTERKVYCPEMDDNCANPNCSTQMCLARWERTLSERRNAEQDARFRNDPANREEAAWRAITEWITEHNALIAANKTGIATNRNGEIITLKVRRPQRGRRGSKKFIARVVASERPEIVSRIENAIDKMLADARE